MYPCKEQRKGRELAWKPERGGIQKEASLLCDPKEVCPDATPRQGNRLM